MPIEFLCPNAHPLIVPDAYAGRQVLCPTCGVLMIAPARTAAAAPLEPIYLPTPIAPDEQASALPPQAIPARILDEPNWLPQIHGVELRKVRMGIILHWSAVIFSLAGGILVALMAAIIVGNIVIEEMEKHILPNQPPPGRVPRRQPPPNVMQQQAFAQGVENRMKDASMTIMLIYLIYSGIKTFLGLLGSIFCLSVPSESRASGFMFIALIMDLLYQGLMWSNRFVFGGQDNILELIGLCAHALCFVFFMLFLTRLANFLNDRDLAQHAMHHMRSWSRLTGGTFAVLIGCILMMLLVPVFGVLLFFLGLLGMGILWLIWSTRYITLLKDMWRLIDFHLQIFIH